MQRNGPIVVALGGNALDAGNSLTDYPQLAPACRALATVAADGLVVTHGNGPQIGMLAQGMDAESERTLDVLNAETEGMIGYLIELAFANVLPAGQRVGTLLTRVEVDKEDPGFRNPSKPIGPWLDRDHKERLERDRHWTFKEQEGRYRRLVPSPKPLRSMQVQEIKTLLQAGTTVICTGGGGVPVCRDESGMHGVEAVVDKDFASAKLGEELDARLLVLATDVDGVYRRWGEEDQEKISQATPDDFREMKLPAGSMGPKVEAACEFVKASGSPAVIGALEDLPSLLAGKGGTRIEPSRQTSE